MSTQSIMSSDNTPAVSRPGSPKRNHDATLSFAYDDQELPSDVDQDFHTPASHSSPNGTNKRRKTSPTRPRTLNYTPYLTLRGHKRGVACVKLSPNGSIIASASADSTIKLWDAKTGALQQTLEGHLAGVNMITWSPDSGILASGSDDKVIRLWDTVTGRCVGELRGHHNYVYSLAFAPKGNMLVSGSYDEAVFLWDVRTARLMRSLPAHSDPVSGVDFVRDGTLIASCSSDGLIRIWDTGTGQCLKTLVHEDNAAVTSVKFSPNGRYVLAATLDSCVRLWNYVEGRVVKTYQGHKNVKYSMNVCFGTYGLLESSAPDAPTPQDEEDEVEEGERQKQGQWAFAAIGSEDGSIAIWDVSSKEMLQKISGHASAVLSVDVGSDDQMLVSGGLDGTVRVWKRAPITMTNGHDTAEVNGNGISDEIQLEGSGSVINGIAERPASRDTGEAIDDSAGGNEMERAMAMVLDKS
jgi:COMPASS component SWD3